MTEAEIFAAAIKLSGDARQAFLNAACGPDARHREQVEALLRAHDESGGLLPKMADPYRDETHAVQGQAVPGVVIAGRYKLLEQIGEGGMGTVWVAEQSQPVKRKVALKLIKAGMDSKSVLARFDAERQALALMDHPNIAKVLDGGLTETGRPYFVMDYVKGIPITEYCDATRLSVPDRLQLFVQVCQAVQHAHQKGIIHRDLKPSNILVAPYDDKPVPKVIDFGLAKAMNQSLTEKTLHTAHDMVLGTPQYMSPEQATFNNLDIDTRSDVYSLGTLLYELLAGSPPFAQPELEKRGLLEILRVVREEEPQRPSLKLSTAEARASISANRGSEPLHLTTMMRGELDWIVMRALEKDRTRRYETANGFAADIQRYLAGEQVQAVPPSLAYRLKKAYRRNRVAVLVGTAFGLMLLTGVAVASVLAVQARRAEKIAEENMKQAVYNQAQADAARDEAIKNQKGWVESTWAYKSLAVEAAVSANSARIDADLLEYKSDSKVGLLRLARPLKDSVGPIPMPGRENSTTTQNFPNDPEFVKLREFQTAAVITAGQKFVPLVPPIEDGDAMETSPDGRLLLTGQERTGLKLVAIPSLETIGIVREANERLVRWGFSPDSQTVWTQDVDSIVRFWNIDGTLRAKTPLRPERFIYPAGMTLEEIRTTADLANPILVSDGVALLRSEQRVGVKSGKNMIDLHGKQGSVGPLELYSTRTGNFLRRLDQHGYQLSDWQISPDNRWLIYIEEPETDGAQVVIVATADGQELARLKNLDTRIDVWVNVSPFGKWILTGDRADLSSVKLWRTSDWTQIKDAALEEALSVQDKRDFGFYFVTDDLIHCGPILGIDSFRNGIIRIGTSGSWIPEDSLPVDGSDCEFNAELSGTLLRSNRLLFTNDPINRLTPPQGRKYADELIKIAPDGRFFENLDTVTEKELTVKDDIDDHFNLKYVSGFGQIVMLYDIRSDCQQIRIVPDASRLNIPPAMLELWTQVVTGGELATDGRFKAWDEPTWQGKQKELAAMKPPYQDFPFPGWVATEPHLWWRIQANMTQNSDERNKLLDEWRHRSGRVRPEPQPDTWRTPGPVPPTEQSQSNTSGGSSVSDALK